uniref:HTH psq-type domain-containing protein n=1 Tax=Clytia hemisphaerica TaxID=252671 RepID=A0A7M5XHY1_9CNID
MAIPPTSATGSFDIPLTSTTGSVTIPPTSATVSVTIPQTSATGSVAIQPTSTTGSVAMPPTSTTSSVAIPLTSTTGSVAIPAFTLSLLRNGSLFTFYKKAIPSASATGSVAITPTSTTGSVTIPPTSTTGSVAIPPTNATVSVTIPPTSATGSVAIPPTSTTGSVTILPTSAPFSVVIPPTSTTGSVAIPPTSATFSVSIPSTRATGSVAIPPTSTTGSVAISLKSLLRSVAIPPTSATGSVVILPTSTNGSVAIPPTSTTGSFDIPPTSTNGSVFISLRSLLGSVAIPPTSATGSVAIPPTSTTGSVAIPPTSTTGSVAIPPSSATGSVAIPLMSTTGSVAISLKSLLRSVAISPTSATGSVAIPPTSTTGSAMNFKIPSLTKLFTIGPSFSHRNPDSVDEIPKKAYKTFPENVMQHAIQACINKELGIKEAARVYNLPKSTLHRRVTGLTQSSQPGRRTILTKREEARFTTGLNAMARWHMPYGKTQLQLMVKRYLDKSGQNLLFLKDNLPGDGWARGFIRRNKIKQTKVKSARFAVTNKDLKDYYKEVTDSLKDIPPSHIFNYGETNLTDLGKEVVLVRRVASKRIEKCVEHSKQSYSIMYCGNAIGQYLPPMIVYKAETSCPEWEQNGVEGAQYDATDTGWFDMVTFETWFHKVLLPNIKGNENSCIIGDNLPSHLSLEVIEECERRNISFILLPPNSTHLTQPLDVAVFKGLETKWRDAVNEWRKTAPPGNIPKAEFPALVKKVHDQLEPDTLISGFRLCGIHPLDATPLLRKVPSSEDVEQREKEIFGTVFMEQVLEVRDEMVATGMKKRSPPRKRKRKR